MVSKGNTRFNRKMELLNLCLKGATREQLMYRALQMTSKKTAQTYVDEVILFVQQKHKQNQVID